jgi:hypothetical protein
MMRQFQRLIKWLTSTRGPRWHVREIEDFPDALAPLTVYVIGEHGHQWYAAMQCPCGCGDTLQLSLHRDANPRWTLRRRWDGAATLSPSIWRRAGCRSHFFLHASRVRWV